MFFSSQGFDPLGLAKRKDLLLQYREAELKHARLAMLASVGWAASELIHPKLAALLGVKSLLQPGSSGQLEKAPSVLNGGLNAVPPLAWAGLVLLTGIVEVISSPRLRPKPVSLTSANLEIPQKGPSEEKFSHAISLLPCLLAALNVKRLAPPDGAVLIEPVPSLIPGLEDARSRGELYEFHARRLQV